MVWREELLWSLVGMTAMLAVVVSDTLYRRIPNAMSAMVCLIGCAYWAKQSGWVGFRFALLGGCCGALLLMMGYVMRWVGAADVKVFFGFGAWLGPSLIVRAALFGLMTGGMLSVAAMLYYGVHWRDLRFRANLRPGGQNLERARQQGTTVPLAAALSLGVLLAALGF